MQPRGGLCLASNASESCTSIRSQRAGTTHEWPHVNVYHVAGDKITEIWWTPFDQPTVAALFA